MKKAFTLIELLIVIAIIAILALIAVPNFLEAQTRAKVSRVEADMRSVATALEAYFVDYNSYPYGQGKNNAAGCFKVFSDGLHSFDGLSTPIAYIAPTAVQDPFRNLEDTAWERTVIFVNILGGVRHLLAYGPDCAPLGSKSTVTWTDHTPPTNVVAPAPLRFNGPDSQIYNAMWMLANVGPDRKYDDPFNDQSGKNMNPNFLLSKKTDGWDAWTQHGVTDMYDPTNGTMSRGNIFRLGGGANTGR